jgi:hypothetical protein
VGWAEVGVAAGEEDVGVGVGDEEEVAVADGEDEGDPDGVAGDELPWAGPTRFGVCTG